MVCLLFACKDYTVKLFNLHALLIVFSAAVGFGVVGKSKISALISEVSAASGGNNILMSDILIGGESECGV